MERWILHCDCNGFYASVECMDNPALNSGPMAVAGDPKKRTGIILAKNEQAKAFGVRTAETVWQALKKCPQLTLVPPRHDRYREISRRVNAIYQEYTDRVEPFGIDESWLDVTETLPLLGTDARALADLLRKRVRTEIGITISVGVSFNKVFAKLGSDLKKPDATTVVLPSDFREIVWPLPAESLLFVGRHTSERFRQMGIRTIGDIARADPSLLREHLGKAGDTLWRYAHGLDDDPVARTGERAAAKSIGNGRTFPRDLTEAADLEGEILALTDAVAVQLRRSRQKCRTVQLAIKFPDLHVISRQMKLPRPSYLQKEIAEGAVQLLRRHRAANAPVRALTVTAADLVGEDAWFEQTSLFPDPDEAARRRQETLEKTMDDIRSRYGTDSITLGAGIGYSASSATGADDP